MDKQEFLQGINKLELAYSRKFSKEQLQFWYEKLKSMNFSKFNIKIDEIITKNTFMPSLAEIITEPKRQFSNHEQREYANIDFNQFYINKE